MNNFISMIAFFIMVGLYLFSLHKLDKVETELKSCNKSRVDNKELLAYQQMDTTNQKTIKLLYDINSQIHHKYDSLLNVK